MKLNREPQIEVKQNIKVLFIEDDETDVKLCVHALHNYGYNVDYDVADSESLVLTLIESKEYDVIISDYGLPGWNGFDAYRKLREIGCEQPLILVTGTLGDESAVDCIKGGISDYVLKDNLARLPVAVARSLKARVLADELQLAENKLHLLSPMVEQSTDSMICTDIDFRIIYINEAAERLFGWTQEELIGKHPEFLRTESDTDPTQIEWRAIVSSGTTYSGERLNYRKDGSMFHCQLKVSPLFDKDQQIVGYMGCLKDVTEQKCAEEQIKQLYDGLEHQVVERTAELETTVSELEAFSYAVSHDLRTPLRHIVNSTESVLETEASGLDEPAREELTSILETCERMGNIIKGLMTLSRVSRSEMYVEPVDLCVIAREISDGLRLSEPDRSIDIGIPESLITNGDEQLLGVALLNLLQNAWKFTSKNRHAKIKLGSMERNGTAVYFVSDNGVGFDMKYADRIFEPFKRMHSKTEFEGIGIGLATTKRIIERHGGSIWFEGIVGEGATFYFTLQPGQVQPLTED